MAVALEDKERAVFHILHSDVGRIRAAGAVARSIGVVHGQRTAPGLGEGSAAIRPKRDAPPPNLAVLPRVLAITDDHSAQFLGLLFGIVQLFYSFSRRRGAALVVRPSDHQLTQSL